MPYIRRGWSSDVAAPTIDWNALDAVLFDLDGVLTPTAVIHERAWKTMFDSFLEAWAKASMGAVQRRRLSRLRRREAPRRRRALVHRLTRHRPARGHDRRRPGHGTVNALGNAKNERSRRCCAATASSPIRAPSASSTPSPGGARPSASCRRRATPPRCSRPPGSPIASPWSSTATSPPRATPWQAGAGHVPRRRRRLGASPHRTAVVEDAISGVAAGHAGGFALVVGVDRGAGHDALVEHGADVVVDDLDELADITRRGRGMTRRAVPEHLPQFRYPADPWKFVEVGFSREDLPLTETLFAVANGYLGCAATTRRAATPTIPGRSSTASTRRGASTTPSRRSGSPRPGRRSSTCPIPSRCRSTSTTNHSSCRSPTSPRMVATRPAPRHSQPRPHLAHRRRQARASNRSAWSAGPPPHRGDHVRGHDGARRRADRRRLAPRSTARTPSTRRGRRRSPSPSVSPTRSATRGGIARSTTACCSHASTPPTIGRWCSATSAPTARCRSPARRATRSSRRGSSTSTSRSAR